MIGFLIAYVILLIAGLWIVIQVGRERILFGVLVFFLPIAWLVFLFRNWGTEYDVRLPSLVSVLALGWIGYLGYSSARDLSSGMAPDIAATLERGEALTPDQTRRFNAQLSSTLGGDNVEVDEVDPVAFEEAARRLSAIERQRGIVVLPEASARLDVPLHFRFLQAEAVRTALQGSDVEFDPGFIGLVVHESIDLREVDQWTSVIEVSASNDGHVKVDTLADVTGSALALRAQAAAAEIAKIDVDEKYHNGFAGFLEGPEVDMARHSATWVSKLDYHDGEDALHCESVRLGRKTQVHYRLLDTPPEDQELCLRQVRLLAHRTTFAAGEDYADTSVLDRKSRFDLAAWVTGEQLLHTLQQR